MFFAHDKNWLNNDFQILKKKQYLLILTGLMIHNKQMSLKTNFKVILNFS